MPQSGSKSVSPPKERKISARRLKDLRTVTYRTERRLFTLLKRVDEITNLIDAPEQNGKRKLVLEKEYIDSEVSNLNASLDRLSKTHSDYLAKNQGIDAERLGLGIE